MSQSQCQQPLKSVAFVGTYLPRRCGIAVFTSSLCEADRPGPRDRPARPTPWLSTIRPKAITTPSRSASRSRANLPREYRHAAEFLNMHEADGGDPAA